MAQREYENLAKQFLRLAEQAKHNASVQPPVKISRQSVEEIAPDVLYPAACCGVALAAGH